MATVLAAGLLVGAPGAAPRIAPPRLDPGAAPDAPTAIHRAREAVVGIRATVRADRPSAATLGTERAGSAVVIAADGLAVTVGYLVLEADRIEARLADGRAVPAHVVGHDFESGLGLIRLEGGGGRYPALVLGRSRELVPGTAVAIVGMGEEPAPTARTGRVTAVQPFVAYWEYALERALVVTPLHPAFGGAALVDGDGALVGVVSLRLPEGHVAIPIDLLPPVQAALVAGGRPPGPGRPWLGIRAVAIEGGVGVASVSPAGPAHVAGLRAGDVIVRLNGDRVADVADLYRRLWRVPVGGAIELAVFRDDRLETVTVRARDRYSVFQFRAPRLPGAVP
jgi:S1-C subfamily serine protease